MRTYTAHHVRYHAHKVQESGFYSGVGAAISFIGFALFGMESAAMAVAIVGGFVLGTSVGAWIVANHFED